MAADPAADRAVEEGGGDTDLIRPVQGTEPPDWPAPAAGTLTAGARDDNRNWDAFLDNAGQLWGGHMADWGLFPTRRVEVLVTAQGEGVQGAQISLRAGESILWEAVSDYEGRAFLFYGLDGTEPLPDGVSAAIPDGGETAVALEQGQETVALELPAAPEQAGKQVDVMFVVDTTGSMSDELDYLKAELEHVMLRAGEELANASFRLSVNFYRDEGDEYVVRYFRFHDELSQAVENLRAQSANGGGDYPEAVDQALDNAVNGHAWEEDAVKILFLVLDAPPHLNEETAASLHSTLAQAAAMGIRIIPVASSGVDEETEFLTRTAAALTGGTYTFLTDDSGVGNSHKAPTNIDYQTEPLNQLLLRLILLYAG